ncbi:uncharacterized protein EAE97_001198 [Botrytis byssoidea]|uniref:Uncharacterized protein n=1 Tax=Botrytis byssoidea TaxID=139641 RepID=A0A9P5M9I7_9HELO|nr:uncharacterized protein EAE97_001198 [Botrytis byssoidea]KAF7953799.1 hypothetical protein EAE97_001198 [Botrytis byssoidea]
MAGDHYNGLDVPAATEGSEHPGVLDGATVINGPAVEETIVADTANDSHASERDGGGLDIAGESDASGDSDEGDPVEQDNNGHQDATIDAKSQLKRPKHATSVKKYLLLRRSTQVELSPHEIDKIISSLRKRNGRALSPREAEKRRQEYYNHKNEVYHPENAAQVLSLFGGKLSPGSILDTKVDIINVYATQAAGYPVLRLKDEMAYYDVKPKVKCSDHEEEYLVPYCLPAVAIITTFSWRFIDQWRDYTGFDEEAWYREFVIRLALAHEGLRQAKMEARVASLGFETALVIKVKTLSLNELIEYFTAPLKELQRFLAILKARSQENIRGNTDNGEESAATSTSQKASSLTK